MKNYTILFIKSIITLFLFIGCSSTLSPDKVYEIYTVPIRSDVEFFDEESDYPNTYLKTQEIKIYFRIFENGSANGIIESDGKFYSLSGDFGMYPKSKVTNETYIISLESNRNRLSLTIDNDTKDVRSSDQYGVFKSLNSIVEKSDISVKVFNNMYEQGSTTDFFQLTLTKGDIQSTELTDYWLNYFGYQNIVNKRITNREEERTRLAAVEDERNKIREEKQRLDELNNRICNSIKNYDVREYITYVPGIDMEYIELARKGASGEETVGGRPMLRGAIPKSRVGIGYILDKGVVTTFDGTPYTGPFTYIPSGNRLYIGAYGVHGVFDELNLLTNQSVDKYLARCG